MPPIGVSKAAILGRAGLAGGGPYWVVTWGGASNDRGTAVAVDSDDNVIVTGNTESYGGGSQSGFVAKFDVEGVLQWDKSIDFNNGIENMKSVACNNFNEIWVAGDASLMTQTSGGIDYFFMIFNSDGTFTAAEVKQFGTAGDNQDQVNVAINSGDKGVIAAADGGGALPGAYTVLWYDTNPLVIREQVVELRIGVLGTSLGDVDIDDSQNAYVAFAAQDATYTNANTACLAKINSSGVVQWARQIYENAVENTWSKMKLAPSGDIFVYGTSGGNPVIAKYNNSGVRQAYKTFENVAPSGGGYTQFNVTDIAIDAQNNVYVTANQAEFAAFVSGYIIKFDSNLNIIWQRSFSADSSLEILGITIDSNGDMLVTGWINRILISNPTSFDGERMITWKLPSNGDGVGKFLGVFYQEWNMFTVADDTPTEQAYPGTDQTGTLLPGTETSTTVANITVDNEEFQTVESLPQRSGLQEFKVSPAGGITIAQSQLMDSGSLFVAFGASPDWGEKFGVIDNAGNLKWQRTLSAYRAYGFAVNGDKCYVATSGSDNFYMAEYDEDTGERLRYWTYQKAVNDDEYYDCYRLYANDGHLYVIQNQRNSPYKSLISKVSLATGLTVWQREVGPNFTGTTGSFANNQRSPHLAFDGTTPYLILTDVGANQPIYICRMDPTDGTFDWEYQINGLVGNTQDFGDIFVVNNVGINSNQKLFMNIGAVSVIEPSYIVVIDVSSPTTPVLDTDLEWTFPGPNPLPRNRIRDTNFDIGFKSNGDPIFSPVDTNWFEFDISGGVLGPLVSGGERYDLRSGDGIFNGNRYNESGLYAIHATGVEVIRKLITGGAYAAYRGISDFPTPTNSGLTLAVATAPTSDPLTQAFTLNGGTKIVNEAPGYADFRPVYPLAASDAWHLRTTNTGVDGNCSGLYTRNKIDFAAIFVKTLPNEAKIVKFNKDGTIDWATDVAGTTTQRYVGIFTDDNGNVFFGLRENSDDKIVCLNASDGSLKWARSTNGRLAGFVADPDGVHAYYAAATSNSVRTFVKINVNTGVVQWTRNVTAGTSTWAQNSVPMTIIENRGYLVHAAARGSGLYTYVYNLSDGADAPVTDPQRIWTAPFNQEWNAGGGDNSSVFGLGHYKGDRQSQFLHLAFQNTAEPGKVGILHLREFELFDTTGPLAYATTYASPGPFLNCDLNYDRNGNVIWTPITSTIAKGTFGQMMEMGRLGTNMSSSRSLNYNAYEDDDGFVYYAMDTGVIKLNGWPTDGSRIADFTSYTPVNGDQLNANISSAFDGDPSTSSVNTASAYTTTDASANLTVTTGASTANFTLDAGT